MEKVIVTGYNGSGRTSYLAGMYDIMSRGIYNFSLAEKDKNKDLSLHRLWTEINHGTTRKWPNHADGIRSNSFSFFHNSDKIIEFEWLDYPVTFSAYYGGRVTNDFKKQFSKAECCLIFINGESFIYEGNPVEKIPIRTKETNDYKQIVAQNLIRNKDIEAIRQLSQISDDVILPPIGIVITKSDLIDDMWIPYVGEIIKENFWPLFGEGGQDERIVMVAAVTLGNGIENGADARPEYIEQPIAFAVLSILKKYIETARCSKAQDENELREKKISRSVQSRQLREHAAQMDEVINHMSRYCVLLLEVFGERKLIYINGNKQNFCDYFRSVIG